MSDPVNSYAIGSLQQRVAGLTEAVEANTATIAELAACLDELVKSANLKTTVKELAKRLEGRMKPPPPEAHEALGEHPEDFT